MGYTSKDTGQISYTCPYEFSITISLNSTTSSFNNINQFQHQHSIVQQQQSLFKFLIYYSTQLSPIFNSTLYFPNSNLERNSPCKFVNELPLMNNTSNSFQSSFKFLAHTNIQLQSMKHN